jgi:flagellar motor switch protein FliN/FliY
MAPFDRIDIELSVLVGETSIPLATLLKLERGGFIPLGRDAGAPISLLANGLKVAQGKVELAGAGLRVIVTEGVAEAA